MAQNTTTQQVSIRMDTRLKQEAEGVLALMGSSATELVRSVYQKVARGADDYLETMRVLKGEDDAGARKESPLLKGWAAAERFYQSVGYDPKLAGAANRPWREVYEEAMASHFAEKGILS